MAPRSNGSAEATARAAERHLRLWLEQLLAADQGDVSLASAVADVFTDAEVLDRELSDELIADFDAVYTARFSRGRHVTGRLGMRPSLPGGGPVRDVAVDRLQGVVPVLAPAGPDGTEVTWVAVRDRSISVHTRTPKPRMPYGHFATGAGGGPIEAIDADGASLAAGQSSWSDVAGSFDFERGAGDGVRLRHRDGGDDMVVSFDDAVEVVHVGPSGPEPIDGHTYLRATRSPLFHHDAHRRAIRDALAVIGLLPDDAAEPARPHSPDGARPSPAPAAGWSGPDHVEISWVAVRDGLLSTHVRLTTARRNWSPLSPRQTIRIYDDYGHDYTAMGGGGGDITTWTTTVVSQAIHPAARTLTVEAGTGAVPVAATVPAR